SGNDSKKYNSEEFLKSSNIYKYDGKNITSIFNQSEYLNEDDWKFEPYIEFTIIDEELMYIFIDTEYNVEVSGRNIFEIKGKLLLFNYIEKIIIKEEKFFLTEEDFIYNYNE